MRIVLARPDNEITGPRGAGLFPVIQVDRHPKHRRCVSLEVVKPGGSGSAQAALRSREKAKLQLELNEQSVVSAVVKSRERAAKQKTDVSVK